MALAALTSTGCVLTSAQILASFDLPNPFTIDATDNMERVTVDLNRISDYADNKDKLKGLSDFAVLGTFTNTLGPAGTVTVYIDAGTTNHANAQAVINNATKLWGPASIGAAGSATETVTLSWDDSAALLDAAGKQIVLDEAEGDGRFTIYTVGTPGGTYNVRVDDGFLVLVLDAGL
ncbi:MAG TPA: hypothetical protein VEY91_02225 [Candidatus Limnocylindria bacterium]|nr:hypothetical protein [Candidatus Limnocylindria bacterium]